MEETEQYKYRYELHAHDCLCSACAHSTPEEMVQAYLDKGYAGMAFTNHFLRGNTAVDRGLPWEDKMHAYYDAYLRAVDYAKGRDFDVFFGIEHNYGSGKEVLTYNITLDFLLEHPFIDRLPLEDYAKLVHEAGGFLSMAHPFRHARFIDAGVKPQPEFLDGAEVFNFFNTEAENNEALELARMNRLIMTSGGDTHDKTENAIGMAGIALPHPVHTSQELVDALRNREHRLIINGTVPVPA